MSITTRSLVVAVACSLLACTTSTPQPPPADRSAAEPTIAALEPGADEASLFVVRQVIPPTPEMLRAALSNDPDAMRDAAAATLTGCQAASSCPAQFASCTSWSATTQCSSTCGPGMCFCRPIRFCEGEPPVPRGTDTFNAFRVCFDPAQHACTEWQQTVSTFCGC